MTATRRGRAIACLAAGLAGVLVANVGSLARPAPLFDGVLVEDPYRYVDPPAGAAGDPFATSENAQVVNGAVALIAVATGETPPQAQVIAQADGFAISPDTTSILVSIQPASPPDAEALGNLYRILVTDQAGIPLAIRPGTLVTVVLRAPQANAVARVARRDGNAWTLLATDHGGLPDLYAANVDQLGDFAVVLQPGASPAPSAGSSPGASPGSADGSGGVPTWLLLAFVIAAMAVGLLWARVGDVVER